MKSASIIIEVPGKNTDAKKPILISIPADRFNTTQYLNIYSKKVVEVKRNYKHIHTQKSHSA